MLHCFMGVMRKLVGLMMNDLSSMKKAIETESVLKGMHIKIPEAEGKQTLWERWDKARFGRPEWITILDNVDKLVELLTGTTKTKVCIAFDLFP
jgi:hypothetical protein